MATGSRRTPVESGDVSLEELEVLGDQEDEAGEREERDRDRDARRGETRLANRREVEHRVLAASLPGDERARPAARVSAKPTERADASPAAVGASMIV